MIRISSVTVQGFKNVSTEKLELDNFNIIVGPNNSGKSNFIQFFSFLNFIIYGSSNEVERSFNDGRFEEFGRIIPHDINDVKGDINFEITFEDTIDKNIYEYNIQLNWERNEKDDYRFGTNFRIKREAFHFKNQHATGPLKRIFYRDKNKVNFGDELSKTGIIEKIPNSFSVLSILKIVLGRDIENSAFKKSIDSLEKILKSETFYFSNIELSQSEFGKGIRKFGGRTVSFLLEEEIHGLTKNKNNWELFQNALRNILNIDGVEVFTLPKMENPKGSKDLSEEIIIGVEHFNSYKRIYDLSDGSILIIALITKILTSGQDIFVIEEPENSIHPKALIDLIRFFQSFTNEKQFIITTHSITLINSVSPNNVIIAKCDNKGKSNFCNVKDTKELRKRLKEGYIAFSDYLFFESQETDEEEIIY